jgi:hypothetical protein
MKQSLHRNFWRLCCSGPASWIRHAGEREALKCFGPHTPCISVSRRTLYTAPSGGRADRSQSAGGRCTRGTWGQQASAHVSAARRAGRHDRGARRHDRGQGVKVCRRKHLRFFLPCWQKEAGKHSLQPCLRRSWMQNLREDSLQPSMQSPRLTLCLHRQSLQRPSFHLSCSHLFFTCTRRDLRVPASSPSSWLRLCCSGPMASCAGWSWIGGSSGGSCCSVVSSVVSALFPAAAAALFPPNCDCASISLRHTSEHRRVLSPLARPGISQYRTWVDAGSGVPD